MRAHFRGGMLGELEELWDHVVEWPGTTDFYVHFARIVFACFFQSIECGLSERDFGQQMEITHMQCQESGRYP